MIGSFRDRGTEDVFNDENTKKARQQLPMQLHTKAGELMDRLNAATALDDLSAPGLHLTKMRGTKDRWEVRINDQYRIVFRWKDGNAWDVWAGDPHA